MPVDTRQWREDRAKLYEDSRAILDKADEEKRDLTSDERNQYDRFMDDADKLRVKIEDGERRNDLERFEQEQRNRKAEEDEKKRSPDAGARTEDHTEVFGGDWAIQELSEERRTRFQPEYHRGFCKRLFGRGSLEDEEHRAQIAGKGEKGGYLYASETFINELLRDVIDATKVRQFARGFRIDSDSLGVPTLTDVMADAEWTSELGVPTRGTIKFGKRALTPHPLAKEIPVSKVLVRRAPNIVSIVREELARVVGAANENGFMTGDGTQKPLGMFVASADGINTGRDVSTDNTSTLVKADNIKRCKYTLKEVYWARARWIIHRTIMGQIARLKDGNGQYLLQPGIRAGEPVDMLEGFPVTLSEYAPSTTGSGNYAAILGDLSNYWIVDSWDVEITRAEEIYVRENQDLFIIRTMTDGAPVREEAFVRSTFA